MMESVEKQKKIIEALTVIKEECASHGICSMCPLYGDQLHPCKLRDSSPEGWTLNAPVEEWRAIL